MEAFAALPAGGQAWVNADGIHPKYDPTLVNDGPTVWATEANAYFDAMRYRP
jgi:hypothetical protein